MLKSDIDVKVKDFEVRLGGRVKIGDLSKRTGTTERMLRYYEEQGLLKPSRTESGYRDYAESDVQRVANIRCLLTSALPSRVIKHAVEGLCGDHPEVPADPEERRRLLEALQEQYDAVSQRFAELNRSLDQLATIIADVRALP